MQHPYLPHGLFVTFEGPEGSGKSTQIGLLDKHLCDLGYEVLVTREPGGTPMGEELRRILMELRDEKVAPESELLLFGASRAQHMCNVILPHLEKGGVVLCDRFADSTTAYQGYARKLNMDFIQRMHELTLYGRWPDLTLLLDISVDESERRTQQRDGDTPVDRFASENRAFHFAVREGFLDLARHNQKRFRVISADLTVDDVAARIREEVSHVLR
ncbi:MAG: dTMP kinase [Lentisphaeria bacterium]|nr:dTMP kinase [Lentisphaeria bacterium]